MVRNRFGDIIVLDPDLDHSSNFVDPDPHTINADPHHWLQVFRPIIVNWPDPDSKHWWWKPYLFQSWVPVGRRRSTYSAPTIASNQLQVDRFIVVRNKEPPSCKMISVQLMIVGLQFVFNFCLLKRQRFFLYLNTNKKYMVFCIVLMLPYP